MSRAGTGARDQVSRLLTLVPLLHARGELPVAEAAEVLGTTPQQVVKDLKVLWMCGLPGGYPDDLIDIDMDSLTTAEGDGTIRVWNADYLAKPVRLAPREASALAVALRAMRETADARARAVVDRALAKLRGAVREGERDLGVELAPATPVAHGVLTELRSALGQGRQVSLEYWVPSRDERTRRLVDPLRVSVVDGTAYLEAHCTSADDLRVFRLDRVLDLEVRETPVGSHQHDLSTPLAERLFIPDAQAPTVALDLAPRARWVASYFPVEEVTENADGGLRVVLAVRDMAWVRQLVLRLAPDARFVRGTEAPEAAASDALADNTLGEARRALALYSEDDISGAQPG